MIIDGAVYTNGHRVEALACLDDISAWAKRRSATSVGEQSGSAEVAQTGQQLGAPQGDQTFAWVGMRMPSADELRSVVGALAMGDIDIDEIIEPHSRPVLVIDPPVVQLVLRTARYNDGDESISLGEIIVLVSPTAVITVRYGQVTPLDGVRSELEADPAWLVRGPGAVLAAVIDQVITDYGPAVDGFEYDVIEAEREVFSDSRRQPAQRLYALKRQVRDLLVAIASLRDPLARIQRVLGARLSASTFEELGESSEQLERVITRLQSLDNLIDAAVEANMTQVQIRQNEDMRKISAWVAIAAVPTMIAGIYGMNFDHMPELHWVVSYPLVLGVMAAACYVMYRSFKRNDWL
jgi:magnesium transporter